MIRFIKAHACGNDFLVVDEFEVDPEWQREAAMQLCARNTSVGADGVEFLDWTGERSGRIRLFNADGSIAEISGNGTRCVAAWIAYEKEAVAGDTITLETDAGVRECHIVHAEGPRFQIAANMGIPMVRDHSVKLADGTAIAGTIVSTGNPHFVVFVDAEDFIAYGRKWQELGQEICFHPDFPGQTNVEFVRVLSPREIEIRIFERGVGPTTSSGTGTCATAVSAITRGGCEAKLLVRAPGGEQTVEWHGGDAEILLTGPAALIAEGEAF